MSESTDDPDVFHDRLDEVDENLEAAETEADLDQIDESLESIESDLENASLPEPPEPEDDDEEAPPDPREELEDRVDDARDAVDAQRGPYAEDVLTELSTVTATIESTEWAEEGREEVAEAVQAFLSAIEDPLDRALDSPSLPIEALQDALEDASDTIEAADLDPDDDASTIASLLDATDTFSEAVESATAFGDLPVREQLNRRGFFDVLGHYKDFPPEWSALKAHEEARNVEMILLAYELLDSNFMEEHCIDSLRRLGDERALDPMMQLAQRRDKAAIAVLGKIGDPEPIDMLVGYTDSDSDPALQRASITALGEIGSPEATEPVAQQLAAENESVRSVAARSLGMIGDTRAIDPLETLLDEDPAEPVRASAAWALVEIGTEEAIEIVSEYDADGSYLVEAEAAKVTASGRAA